MEFFRVRCSICVRCSILILLIKTVRCYIVLCSIPQCVYFFSISNLRAFYGDSIAVAYFKVLYQHLRESTKVSHEGITMLTAVLMQFPTWYLYWAKAV